MAQRLRRLQPNRVITDDTDGDLALAIELQREEEKRAGTTLFNRPKLLPVELDIAEAEEPTPPSRRRAGLDEEEQEGEEEEEDEYAGTQVLLIVVLFDRYSRTFRLHRLVELARLVVRGRSPSRFS